jgi:rSAM/selenodomain-associated transferase 2
MAGIIGRSPEHNKNDARPGRRSAPAAVELPAMPAPPPLSIVIPALDAAADLPATLAALEEGRTARLIGEILVVDGGSRDATRSLAAASGARVIEAVRGRGAQLAAGAAAARGDWLLFLHADTRLAAGWPRAVAAFIAGEHPAERVGYFRFRLDDGAPAARRLEEAVAWRCRVLALPYGDQGLLLSAALYRAIGGFRPLPLMEDVDLVRRLGRRRLEALDLDAVTSARRYRRGGYLARPLRNLFCLTLYFIGVPPRLIRRVYG